MPRGRDDRGLSDENRIEIAQGAARLIAEHGIADWGAAKRKAARELGLPEYGGMPDDDAVVDALVDYHAIFGGEEHLRVLRAQREEALKWMRRLAEFRPRLIGGVAEGWATEHSDIRIDLSADDSKAVEIALINNDVRYRAMQTSHDDDRTDLYIDTRAGGVRLIIRSPGAARQRPRRERRGREEARLDAEAVEALLRDEGPGSGS